MNWQPVCTAVIPALNESAAIAGVVAGVLRFLPKVLVIDDGSTDATAAAAKAAGAEVLRQAQTRGKGAALRSGWEAARARGFLWVMMLDGDGQHAPSDIPKFFQRAEATSAPLIIGNRMMETSSIPWLRRHVNRWMSRRISHLAGRDLPDSQCGFRLMNLESWSKLTISANHFEIESDILVQFARAALPIEFVPIEVIYKSEHSKIHPLNDTWRWLQWWRRNFHAD